MGQRVNPQKFGLSSRTDLEKTGKNHYTIIIDRKSRLVLKDGERIINNIEVMREFVPGAKVDVFTTAPVCKKALRLLNDHGVDIVNQSK